MIRHIVVIRFRDNVTSEEKAGIYEELNANDKTRCCPRCLSVCLRLDSFRKKCLQSVPNGLCQASGVCHPVAHCVCSVSAAIGLSTER